MSTKADRLSHPLVCRCGASLKVEWNNLRNDEQWVAFELFGNSYVIAGDYKAIRVRTGMYGDGKWHLYNIRNDPGETRRSGPGNAR